MIAMNFFQSGSAEKISIKVCLKIFKQGLVEKVNHLCISSRNDPTSEDCTGAHISNQGLLKKFQSGFD